MTLIEKKFPVEETNNVDKCECVYCGYMFNGRDAVDADLDTNFIICPKCKKRMKVFMSVEYLCLPEDYW